MMKPTIAVSLWNNLWQQYLNRVSYARTYKEMITAAGGTVANDHIAFRSLRLDIGVNLGIEYLESVVKYLGYEAKGEYFFPQTHLYARHYRHPLQDEFNLPKLFISELIVDELPDECGELIRQTVNDFINYKSAKDKNKYESLAEIEVVQEFQKIFTRPWQPPRHSIVEKVNKVTQYGAWVLLHGYAVNHFTAYINRQNTPQYPDIEATTRGLANLGVPMKAEIEGSVDCGLRQTATHAVTEMVTVLDDFSGVELQIPWTYAYYEIAQRYLVGNTLFDAFLGNNAQQLFEMTRRY